MTLVLSVDVKGQFSSRTTRKDGGEVVHMGRPILLSLRRGSTTPGVDFLLGVFITRVITSALPFWWTPEMCCPLVVRRVAGYVDLWVSNGRYRKRASMADVT